VRGSFHDWIRVIVNLAKNSNIDRNERLVAALRGSKQLSLRCGTDFLSRSVPMRCLLTKQAIQSARSSCRERMSARFVHGRCQKPRVEWS
jgi:hypothetical protein